MPQDYTAVPDEYRVELFAETDLVDEASVLGFWDSEVALPAAEARERLQELLFVAVAKDGIAAVSTAYPEWSDRLGLSLWRYRTFVAKQHRESGLAAILGIRAHQHMEQKFVSGEETRAVGGLLEIESEILKTATNTAVWGPPDYTFIGENERGDHLRVHYFPGAQAPPRPS